MIWIRKNLSIFYLLSGILLSLLQRLYKPDIYEFFDSMFKLADTNKITEVEEQISRNMKF